MKPLKWSTITAGKQYKMGNYKQLFFTTSMWENQYNIKKCLKFYAAYCGKIIQGGALISSGRKKW